MFLFLKCNEDSKLDEKKSTYFKCVLLLPTEVILLIPFQVLHVCNFTHLFMGRAV